MLIIGEKINSSNKSVSAAIDARDAETIKHLAKRQAKAGAAYIDINAGMHFADESERLIWLINTVSEATDIPLCLDTPNSATLEAGLKAYARRIKNSGGDVSVGGSSSGGGGVSVGGSNSAADRPIINSITNEKGRLEEALPFALEYNARIIALCMDDAGIPETADGRYSIAKKLISKLTDGGISPNDIFIDPIVMPIFVGSNNSVATFETIQKVKAGFPEVNIVCGLSNSSYGLPRRDLINHAFLIIAMAAGLECAILDPMDYRLMALVAAAEAVLGIDDTCAGYLRKYRDGLFDRQPTSGD